MSRESSPATPRHTARRRLLLAIAAGGAAVPARHIVPDQWGRPMVKSVLLPAHAQTTVVPPPEDECPSTPIASTPSSIATQTEDEPPEDFDNVDINFDGCDNLTLVVTDSDENLGGPDLDIILSLDVDPFEEADESDPEFETFDVTDLGGDRWDVESHSFGGGSDLPQGSYSLTVIRTAGDNVGRRFEIDLTVTVTPVDDTHQQIELSGVTATPL